jgi:hypothetical protein
MTTTTKPAIGVKNSALNNGGSRMNVRRIPTANYDPRLGRPLKSAAEAEAAIERNRKEASKKAKRGWATRRRHERDIGIAAAEAAARDSR